MVSVRQGELLDRYGYWCALAVSVAMILEIIFFIFFRCQAIFAMGPAYDCAVGKGDVFLGTRGVTAFLLWRGREYFRSDNSMFSGASLFRFF